MIQLSLRNIHPMFAANRRHILQNVGGDLQKPHISVTAAVGGRLKKPSPE
jgi:hypothetical protein